MARGNDCLSLPLNISDRKIYLLPYKVAIKIYVDMTGGVDGSTFCVLTHTGGAAQNAVRAMD